MPKSLIRLADQNLTDNKQTFRLTQKVSDDTKETYFSLKHRESLEGEDEVERFLIWIPSSVELSSFGLNLVSMTYLCYQIDHA